MSTQFDLLIEKLEEAMNTPQEGVNTLQCQVEAEIVGYLLGRKVAKNDAKYVPDGFNDHHTMPLRSLNRVATEAFKSMLHKDGMKKIQAPQPDRI